MTSHHAPSPPPPPTAVPSAPEGGKKGDEEHVPTLTDSNDPPGTFDIGEGSQPDPDFDESEAVSRHLRDVSASDRQARDLADANTDTDEANRREAHRVKKQRE